MKFYREMLCSYNSVIYFEYYFHIIFNKLNAVYYNGNSNVIFYKNGLEHNAKNAAGIYINGYKAFHLNGIFYGDNNVFTKQSWYRFVKLQFFK
jgi:hypothetical protein